MDGFCLIRRGIVATLPALCLLALGASAPGVERVIDAVKSPSAIAESQQLNAPTSFAVAQADRVIAARADLARTLASFRSLLARQGADSEAGWLAYLHLDEFEAALDGDTAARLRAIDDLRLRMRTDIVGLEEPEAVEFRAAAARYREQLKLAAPGGEQRVRDAANYVRAALKDVTIVDPDTADKLGIAIGILEQAEQDLDLVETARARWAYPNAVVHVNTEFVAQYIARDVSDYRMQQATILGTQTRGPASTKGRLELITVPNDHAAQFELRMGGSTLSAGNVGRNGPAVIYSSSRSQFQGSKSLFIHPLSGVSDRPASVRTNASIGIKRIDVEMRMLPNVLQPVVERAAWNKAGESQAAVTQEVERLTSQRIQQRFEAEIAEPLRTAQDYFRDYMVVRPTRFDEVPAVVSRSTADYFEVGLRQMSHSQVAADGGPPTFTESTKVGAALHQSLFNNASARAFFADPMMTDERIERYCQIVTMSVPQELRVFSNSKPWSLMIDLERPNTMKFDDGKADVTIHTLQWTLDGKQYTRAIDINFVYRVENSRLGMLFTRVGEVTVTAADGRPWTAEEASQLVPFVQTKCNAMFQEQGRFSSLILPRGEGFGPLGQITLGQVECDDGWLVIGYQ
ncbi:MAG: hypothetical protein C0483_10140 [Pirellula sp.]|nr:hypothetical protein [Pirellula sp.]